MSRFAMVVLGMVVCFGLAMSASADEFVRFEMEGVQGNGHIKYSKGGKELKHRGIDKVEVETGSLSVECQSNVQVLYKGKAEKAAVSQYLIERPSTIQFHTEQRTKIRLTIGNGDKAAVVVEQTVDAGLHDINF